ncbi:MAG: hypothetical protein KF702_11090 [Gammaproteobacteria bacterium]|nr:hypothetical protein [Gammaproteobacteria bacterium]
MDKAFENMDEKAFYLDSEEQRAHYIIDIQNGKMYSRSKQEFLVQSTILYVLASDYTLYGIVVPSEKKRFNHSFFLAGGPVRAAGFIHTNEEGAIKLISNESGHYKPTSADMLPALRFFLQQVQDLGAEKLDNLKYEEHTRLQIKNLNGVEITTYKIKAFIETSGLDAKFINKKTIIYPSKPGEKEKIIFVGEKENPMFPLSSNSKTNVDESTLNSYDPCIVGNNTPISRFNLKPLIRTPSPSRTPTPKTPPVRITFSPPQELKEEIEHRRLKAINESISTRLQTNNRLSFFVPVNEREIIDLEENREKFVSHFTLALQKEESEKLHNKSDDDKNLLTSSEDDENDSANESEIIGEDTGKIVSHFTLQLEEELQKELSKVKIEDETLQDSLKESPKLVGF